MHTNDKNAPKMGTLLYYVNDTQLPPSFIPENEPKLLQYVVAYEGTEVIAILLSNPKVTVKYESSVLSLSIKEAYLEAVNRCRVRAAQINKLADQLNSKAKEIE